MFIFELVIGLLLVGAVLSLWANRLGVPYPALLALTGAMLALVPGMPEVALDPELALALFVAPALLDAAYDASPRDLRANLVPVVSLALGAVAITIAAVALVAHWFVPAMGWAAAITLGAIVAPPDAPAATAVLRRLGLPRRLTVILEGESLFNDASALLVYRFAAAAAITGSFSGWHIVPMLVLTSAGSVVAGIVLARVYLRLVARLQDVPISILLQFISTFAVWILADQTGLSAIIAVVCYAMTLARHAPAVVDARRRVASYAVWEVTIFVLNVLAFVLIGLQLRGIVTRMESSQWLDYALFALAVCAAVILTRIAWWMSHNAISRWRISRFGAKLPRPMMLPTVGTGLIISWCGMRGVVSLALALALPGDFPYRDLIVLCAFAVVLTTLVVQGLTLRWLIGRVDIPADDVVEREIGIARAETARVALRALESDMTSSSTLRREYEARLESGEQLSAGSPAIHTPEAAELQRRVVEAQRQALLDLREREVIGAAAFQAAEEELDLLELTADSKLRTD
ncbi:MAG TPA: cation:proton antiporter [Burkholderiales bacterium]|nr:cation:proton antiporter [Burkholderiales bacterium]